MSLNDEFALIDLIKKALPKPSKRVEVGIGDDAAVVASPAKKIIATADAMVEGVHFDLTYMNARELGHKALAVNLSDCAAMGARPLYALVSLGLKQDLNEFFVEELYAGISKLAKRHKVDIIGGNIVQSPSAILVDITVIAEPSGSYATRSGAKAGNVLAVTGFLGSSAAGLNGLKRLGRVAMDEWPDLVSAHLTPKPRVEEAMALLKTGGVMAMMDISDGLARDLHHLAKASGVGALVDEKAVPIAKGTEKVASVINGNAKAWGMYGGEDYELLVAIDKTKFTKAQAALKKLGCPLTSIGELKPKSEGIKLVTRAGETVKLEPRGWNHFVRRSRLKGDPIPNPPTV